MGHGYWQSLETFESKNLLRVAAIKEHNSLEKLVKEEGLVKENTFRSKLDMAIDNIIRRKFRNIETAMRSDARVSALFRRAKNLAEEVATKESFKTGRKAHIILKVGDLTEREKIILMELIKR
jgi:hypothetical protein